MDEQIIIGEGVILDARPASFATRGVALFLDLVAVVLFTILMLLIFPESLLQLDQFTPAMSIALVVMLLVILPTTVEALTHGRSLGKWAMGLQVVRDDGGPITVRHSFIRAMVGVGELWLTTGIVALIVSLVNPRGKRAGDLLAGTFVLRVRGKAPDPPLFMPPHLGNWARQADMAQLPDGLALSCRQFLGRLNSMHPGSRAQMANNFALQLSKLVAPQPPPGIFPEDFIAAVIVERSHREQASEISRQQHAMKMRDQLQSLPYSIDNPPN